MTNARLFLSLAFVVFVIVFAGLTLAELSEIVYNIRGAIFSRNFICVEGNNP